MTMLSSSYPWLTPILAWREEVERSGRNPNDPVFWRDQVVGTAQSLTQNADAGAVLYSASQFLQGVGLSGKMPRSVTVQHADGHQGRFRITPGHAPSAAAAPIDPAAPIPRWVNANSLQGPALLELIEAFNLPKDHPSYPLAGLICAGCVLAALDTMAREHAPAADIELSATPGNPHHCTITFEGLPAATLTAAPPKKRTGPRLR